MKLAPSRKKKNRPLEAASGCLKTIIGTAVFWVALNSWLIGQAYNAERGSWLPRIGGGLFVFLSALLLWRGVAQFVANTRKPRRGFEDEL